MPSGMRREGPSLAATLSTGTRASAANTGADGARPVAITSAASAAARIEVLIAMSPFPLARSFRCRHCAYAKADDVHAAAALVVVGLRLVTRRVADAAQRQRQRTELLRERQRFGLGRRQFERRGLADHDLLAVFLLHVLVDRQHADIGENGFAAVRVAAAGAFIGVAFAACQNDVDMIVRQDESAGAGLRRNLRGDGAHAGRQDRGHEAGAFGIHELGLADRFAADEWIARDGPGQRFDGVRPIGLADEISSCCVILLPVAALAGHSCHCTSPGETVWPMPISDLATRTSTVAIWTAGAVLTSGGFSERPASMAATPPAATATVSTTRRAAFIRFTLTVT